VCAVVYLHVIVSLCLPHGIALTAFGDLTQCALLLGATLSLASNIKTNCKKARLFWTLMASGCAMWFCTQVLWTYFEVYLRQETPNPFVGDVILFLHLVPMMAAVAIQPHIQRNDRSLRLMSLDFFLLFIWWLYLYLFIVIPWQYVSPNVLTYGTSFDWLYACEQIVLIVGATWILRFSRGAWRAIYGNFVKAVLLYTAGSMLSGVAIDRGQYYTGGLFDIPLVAAMAWFISLGFIARDRNSADLLIDREIQQDQRTWTARLAMLAVFSTPVMIAWAEFGGVAPLRVRSYRLVLTLAAMVVMGALVFLKQHSMDKELLHLLRVSRLNLDEMCQLKDELERKEQSLRWHSLELQRKNLELQEISFTDPLTGVWNRRYLEEILPSEAGQVLRNYERTRDSDLRKLDHRDLVFIMVDVDWFKEVNDVHGHPAGDRLLQRVAERLTKVVRKSDVLVRWGGEEFLIMSRSADPNGIPSFCERILEVMSAEAFELGNGIRVQKTVSVGWAAFPWSRAAYESVCAEETIELADTALYRAKAGGRNLGIGILPCDGGTASRGTITLQALQSDKGVLTRVITVRNSAPEAHNSATQHTLSGESPEI
jgi:diguanylate cyclase (GGDEF)-like protein